MPRHAALTALAAVLALASLACMSGREDDDLDDDATPTSVAPVTATEATTAPVTATSAAATTVGSAIRSLSFDPAALPSGLDTRGEVVGGARWEDATGENLLVLTQVPEFQHGSDPDLRDAELYGYQFTEQGGTWRQVWKIQDFVRECPNDITASHIADSVAVTDLDQDGTAENSFLYRIACRGDVSPATQKLMMHEGASKYALRGTARIEMGGEGYGGEYTVDTAFDGAPTSFLEHAKERWEMYRMETF